MWFPSIRRSRSARVQKEMPSVSRSGAIEVSGSVHHQARIRAVADRFGKCVKYRFSPPGRAVRELEHNATSLHVFQGALIVVSLTVVP